jgi:hypothetical protein
MSPDVLDEHVPMFQHLQQGYELQACPCDEPFLYLLKRLRRTRYSKRAPLLIGEVFRRFASPHEGSNVHGASLH